MQATNDEIGCSGSEKKKNHVADLNVYGLLLRKALQAVSTKDVVKAKYIHYTLHIPAMVEEFGSLCAFITIKVSKIHTNTTKPCVIE